MSNGLISGSRPLPRQAGALLTAVLLGACTSGPTTASPSVPALKGTIAIGVDLPLTAEYSGEVATQHGAQMRLLTPGRVCGAASHPSACFRVVTLAFDDAVNGAADARQGAVNVQRLTADASVLAMIAPASSTVLENEIPIASTAGLAMISPANTNECLTRAPPDGHCAGAAARLHPGGRNQFFRLSATVMDEGPAAADFAVMRLGKHKAYVFNDQGDVGRRLARAFADRFVKDRGQLLDADLGPLPSTGVTASDVTPRVNQAKQMGADVVYFGGGAQTGGPLRHAMHGSLDVPLIGGDGIAGTDFLDAASPDAAGCYFTIAVPEVQQLATAQAFLRAYRSAYQADAGAASAQAYDAAGIILAALSRAIDDALGARPTRTQVLDEVARTTRFPGVTGTITFDQNGDPTLRIVSVYQWNPSTGNADYVDQLSVS